MPKLRRLTPQIERGTGFETLEKKLLDERLQRARSAKLASVSFQSFSMPKNDAASAEHQSGDLGTSPDTAPDSSSARDADNRQDDKNAFLDKKRTTGVVLNQRLIQPTSPYQLMAGTIIPGLLLTGLNSDLPGQILGQVSQNVFDTVSGNHLLLPQGTKVVGQYDSRIVYGQERMLIVWTRLILPNGKSMSLEGMPGVDLSGAAGLIDQVNHHWGRLVTGVVLSSILGAGAQIAQGRTYSTFDPDYGDLAAQGFAQNINQVGQQITRKNLNIQPTIEIRPGYRFNVFVHNDMVLEPYAP
jgi:type IV secretion system protein VirB10